MAGFLHELFRRLGSAPRAPSDGDVQRLSCGGALDQAVEHVVEQTYKPLRAISGYARRLQGPVANTFGYIDELGNRIPGAIACSRSAFRDDPRVNAFFVDPRHLQEVFSQHAEVREVFAGNPEARECWALLCMKKAERRQLGVSLVGDRVQRDVVQTSVSFADHQVVSPGSSEEQARRSLKCRIFNGLLYYIGRQISGAKAAAEETDNRLKALRARLRRRGGGADADRSRADLRRQIENLEQGLAHQDLRLLSLEDHLDFVAQVLENPAHFLTCSSCTIRLSRTGIKLEQDVPDAGSEVSLCEIRIASRPPRVAALVSFPRCDLLPWQDYLIKADLFLAL